MAKINFGGVILLLADDHTVTMRRFVKLARSKKGYIVPVKKKRGGPMPYVRMTKLDLWKMEDFFKKAPGWYAPQKDPTHMLGRYIPDKDIITCGRFALIPLDYIDDYVEDA